MCAFLLPLLLAGPAHAHLPHDIVEALAAPAALDDSEPWFLVADPSSVDLLLRSDDGGLSWQMVGGPPVVDELTDAARLVGGSTALLGEARLWWTDDGQSWSQQELRPGFTMIEARGEVLVVAGPDGIAALRPDQTPTWELDVPVKHLAPGPAGLAAVDDDGGIWVDEDGWVDLGMADAQAISAVATDTAVYAGTRDGRVLRWTGAAWAACGSLPDVGGQPDITHLAASGGVLLAAPAGRAPLASFDGCVTWERREGLFTLYDTEGAATSADEAYSVLLASADRWVIGGWAGLAHSDDAGESWTDATILPADYTRGIAFSPHFETDRTIWLSSYMGGVVRTLDAGETFTAPSLALDDTNVQHLSVRPDHPDRLTAVAGHEAWTSRDGGLSWKPLQAPMAFVQAVHARERGLWVVGRDEDGVSDVVWRSWTRSSWWDPQGESGGGHLAQVVLDERVAQCLSERETGKLLCLATGEEEWRDLLDKGAAAMTAVGQRADGTLVVGHGSHLLQSLDQGGTWTQVYSLTDDLVHTLESAPDGTQVLGTATGRFLVLDPDADAWQDLGVQLPAPPGVIAARPDFEDFPQVLVGTHDGTFVLDIDAGTAERFARVQWIDDATAYLCPDCDRDEDARACFGGMMELAPGIVTRTPVRGSTIAVRGRVLAGAWLDLRVEEPSGQVVLDLRLPGPSDGLGELVAFEGLPEGPYTVVLTGSRGAWVDTVVAEAEAAPLATGPRAHTATGCGLGVGSGLLGVWLAAAGIRRRRRSAPR